MPAPVTSSSAERNRTAPLPASAHDLHMLTFKEVQQIVRYARATIYRKIHEGQFPPGIKLGPHRRVWPFHEIREWIASRIAAGDGFGPQL